MATRTSANKFPDNSTAAAFKVWAQEIQDAILAMGWVQTADTGQLNIAGVSVAPPNFTYVGYQVFRMADTLQATAPVFMRVDYVNDQSAPGFDFRLGSGTNGSGVLTGRFSPPLRVSASNGVGNAGTSTNSYGTMYFSGDTNRLAMWLWDRRNGDVYDNAFFAVERTHDAAGADTNEGLMIVGNQSGTMANGAGYITYFLPFEAGRTPHTAPNKGPAAVLPEVDATGTDGGDTGVYPWRIPSKRGSESPLLNCLTVLHNDSGAPDQFLAVTNYGAAHTYRTMHEAGLNPSTTIRFVQGYGGNNVVASDKAHLAMRWE